MKRWKLAYRVAAISIGVTVIIGIICAAMNGEDGFGLVLGIVCLAGALLGFFIAFVAYLASSKEVAKGFLLCSGILLLFSGISCGTGLSNVNFH